MITVTLPLIFFVMSEWLFATSQVTHTVLTAAPARVGRHSSFCSCVRMGHVCEYKVLSGTSQTLICINVIFTFMCIASLAYFRYLLLVCLKYIVWRKNALSVFTHSLSLSLSLNGRLMLLMPQGVCVVNAASRSAPDYLPCTRQTAAGASRAKFRSMQCVGEKVAHSQGSEQNRNVICLHSSL